MNLRRIALALTAALLSLVLFAPSSANAITTPTAGVYLSCSTYTYCQPHIDRLGYVGIRAVIQSVPNTLQDAQNIAYRWSTWGATVNWSTNNTTWISYLSKYVPNTEGFYIVDEPYHNGVSASTVSTYDANVRSIAPGKGRIMAHWGCSSSQLQTALLPYVTIGTGHGNVCYPYTDGDNSAVDDAGLVYGGFYRLRQTTNTYGKWAFAVPKLFSWSQIPDQCGPVGSGGYQSCAADQFPSQTEFRAFQDCATVALVNRIYWWGYDLWKDWMISGDAGTRARYESRWSTWVNGALVPHTVDGTVCLYT